MIFAEKKIKEGYSYTVEEVFGTMEIQSPDRLVYEDGDAEYLDDVFSAIYNNHQNDTAQEIKGTVKDTEISYTFKKASNWTETLDKEATTFIEEIYNRPMERISSKKKHLFSIWYADNGYKLDETFKNKVINLKNE